MNQQIKKRWIKKLRSRKYKQGHQRLRPDKDSWCCLAVLCDIYKDDHPTAQWITSEGHGFNFQTITPGSRLNDTELPAVVVEWAGLNHTNPHIKEIDLVALNDDYGQSFKQIADRIDKEL